VLNIIQMRSVQLVLYQIKLRVPILILKANEMHYFKYLSGKVLYMFQTGPLPIIRSISKLHTQQ